MTVDTTLKTARAFTMDLPRADCPVTLQADRRAALWSDQWQDSSRYGRNGAQMQN